MTLTLVAAPQLPAYHCRYPEAEVVEGIYVRTDQRKLTAPALGTEVGTIPTAHPHPTRPMPHPTTKPL